MKDYTTTEIRLKKIEARSRKKIYPDKKPDKKYIKLLERQEQLHKHLFGFRGFYARCKRVDDVNSRVDWDSLSEKELNIFEMTNNDFEAVCKSISRYEDKHNITEEKKTSDFKAP